MKFMSYVCEGRDWRLAWILLIAMTPTIIVALAYAAVTARRVDAAASYTGLRAATLVNVHFAQVALVARVAAITRKVVDTVDAQAPVQTRTLGALVDVDFAVVTIETLSAFANVAL